MLSLQLDVQPATESLLNLRLDLKKFESQYQMPYFTQLEQVLQSFSNIQNLTVRKTIES